jgi:hypothetical protein
MIRVRVGIVVCEYGSDLLDRCLAALPSALEGVDALRRGGRWRTDGEAAGQVLRSVPRLIAIRSCYKESSQLACSAG